MEVSYAEVSQILNTLPIGYYLGRKIDVSLSKDRESYFDPMNDKIVIGYEMVKASLKDVPEDVNAEFALRCLLYHEISHAILTPKELKMTDVINIVEDERIEQICKNTYMKVNFKKFVKLVNHYKGQPPKDVKDAFYQLVRYNVGEEKWLKKLEEILNCYKNLNSLSNVFTRSDYVWAIKSFYSAFAKEYEEIQKRKKHTTKDDFSKDDSNEKNKQNDSNEKDEQSDNSEKNTLSNSSNKEEKEEEKSKSSSLKNEDDINTSIEKIDEDKLDTDEKDDSKIKVESSLTDVVNNISEYLSNKDFDTYFNKLFADFRTSKSTNGSAINSYSGVFDYRAVVRDDYKYFAQQNRNGHVKRFSKLHLNLFIDVSGSFRSSEKIVNQFLRSLAKFEKSCVDFDFDVVTISEETKYLNKNERVISCDGGNNIQDITVDIFKKLQKSESTNINLVLFDGDCLSDSFGRRSAEWKNLRDAFDNKNTIIISDNDNRKYFGIFTRAKKIIYTNKYSEVFFENVCQAMRLLIKN